MQPIYHIQTHADRKPSAKQDQLIIDVSLSHVAIILMHNKDLLYLDMYSLQTNDSEEAIDELSALLSDHSLLQISFENVKVIYHTPDTILVPNAFYQADKVDQLLHWQYGDAANYFPMQTTVAKSDIHILYAVPEALHHIITIHFPSAQFIHAHAATLRNVPIHSEAVIHIEVYPNEWICALWQNKKLQIVRSISNHSGADISYVLLSLCKTFNMSAEQTKLQIGGFLTSDDERVSLLQRFFKSIDWNEKPFNSDYPDHFLSSIINQAICEL